jgi:beta-galactosidase
MPVRCHVWKIAGRQPVVTGIASARKSGGTVRITADMKLPAAGSTCRITYAISGDGGVEVDFSLRASGNLPEIPRIGMQMALPGRYTRVRWFGRGPHENYLDRRTGAPVGLYSSDVKNLVFPYLRPQENGYRTEVRWIAVTDARNRGLLISGIKPICFSAWRYSIEDLEAARHDHELPGRDAVTLCIDLAQMGLGGDNCWGAWPHPEYLLKPGREYRYRFRIQQAP